MNKKRCHTLLPLVQLLPTVAAAAAVLFALPRTVPVLAAVPEKLTTVVEQPVEAASSEAEEETLPKLPYTDGVYVGSSRGYGGAVRVQVTMGNGSITEVEILDASHETKQFLRRAKRLLTTVVETQSWKVDAGPVGAFVVQRVRKFHPAIFFSIFQCVPQFIISHCRFSFYCDDVCSGTSPRQRHLPVFSQSVCREFVWEQRIRPGSLCRASVVRFICLCSLPCVGDSINPFSYHVNRFMPSKTSPANDRSANRSPLQ